MNSWDAPDRAVFSDGPIGNEIEASTFLRPGELAIVGVNIHRDDFLENASTSKVRLDRGIEDTASRVLPGLEILQFRGGLGFRDFLGLRHRI